MDFKDYYKILGVARNAPAAEIKKKFRDLAKKSHPDANPGNKQAEARFKEISEAYEIIGDEAKRKKYDELLKYGYDPSAGGFKHRSGGGNVPPGGFEDLFKEMSGYGGAGGDGFSDLFDRLFGKTGRTDEPTPRRGRRGEDIELETVIGFREAVKGGVLTLRFPQASGCDLCGGSGARPGGEQPCGACRGTGQVSYGQGAFSINRPCPTCMGKGRIVREPCVKCGGAGSVSSTRMLRVNVPPGASDGQRIRVAGEGQRGRDGQPGNLFVTLRVKEDPDFSRRDGELHTKIAVTYLEAILGARKKVPTPYGDVMMTIPAGVQPGTKLKLKGRGLVHRHGVVRDGAAGDLFVEVEVRIPRHVPEGAAEKLTAIDRESEY